MSWAAPEPPIGQPGTWVRRVYDDHRYTDGMRHLSLADEPIGVRAACGHRLVWVTNAKVPNRLVPAPASLLRSDIATCAGCQRYATAHKL